MSRQRDRERARYQIRNGFLSAPARGPTVTMDAYRTRDQEQEQDPQDPQDPNEETLEIHNHVGENNGEEGEVVARYEPEDFEDMSEQVGDDAPGEEVARYPASGYTCQTEGDEIVIYRTSGGEGESPAHKTDKFDMSARDKSKRAGPPRSLAALNAYHANFYKGKGGRR
jgi:hypothetical protein